MTLPPVIGLIGRARAGKDTVAMLIKRGAPQYDIVRLSHPIKAAACGLFGLSEAEVETNAKEQPNVILGGKTPRDAMVWLSEQTMKEYGQSFFMERLMSRHANQPMKLVVDVRTASDVDTIRNLGGVIIGIRRPYNPIRHAHEDSIDDVRVDIDIINDSCHDSLRRVVDVIVSELKLDHHD